MTVLLASASYVGTVNEQSTQNHVGLLTLGDGLDKQCIT